MINPTHIELSGRFEVPTVKLANGDIQIEWPEALYTQLMEAAPDGNFILTAGCGQNDQTFALGLYPYDSWLQVEQKLAVFSSEEGEHQRLYRKLARLYLGNAKEVTISDHQFLIHKELARLIEFGDTTYLSGQSWKVSISSETERVHSVTENTDKG